MKPSGNSEFARTSGQLLSPCQAPITRGNLEGLSLFLCLNEDGGVYFIHFPSFSHVNLVLRVDSSPENYELVVYMKT